MGTTMKREPTAEQFLAEVAKHQMTVELNQGLHRNLKFGQPTNSNMWFGLATWPGYLTIYGDMGTWTFRRLDDMFRFFRDEELKINPSYWAEKIKGGNRDGSDSAKVFEEEEFRERLFEQLEHHYGFDGDKLKEIREALEEDLDSCGGGEHFLMNAAYEFSHGERGDKFHFDPCELPSGKVYSYHFIWCLYAIVWGIQQFDVEVSPQ